jgi:protein-disulfide isomerase
MTYGSSGDSRLSKNERREAARVKAKELREQQKKKERQRKIFVQGGVIVGALAIITAVTLVILNGIQPAGPGPLNMLSDGIKIGKDYEAVKTPALQAGKDPIANTPDKASSVIDIQIYVDYMCPICGAFEAENNAQISTWVKSGAATIEIHPIAILNNSSQGTQYSTRAANAAACVANYDPNHYFEYSAALFVDQPKEQTTGLTNEELFKRAQAVKVSHEGDIKSCINDVRFKNWVQDATERALNGPIPNSDVDAVKGTPTVIVNGQKFNYSTPFSKDEFAAFVIQAAGTTFNDNSTPTATPTPEPSPSATP